MDKQKQIEEMALIISGSNELDTMNYYKARNKAKALYEQGYRKIEQGSVVLTEEEFSAFRQTIIAQSQEYTKLCDEMNNKIIKARKQAVKEFAERLKELWQDEDASCWTLLSDIDVIAKEFGVEV